MSRTNVAEWRKDFFIPVVVRADLVRERLQHNVDRANYLDSGLPAVPRETNGTSNATAFPGCVSGTVIH